MADGFHVKVEVEKESSIQPESSSLPEPDTLIIIIVVQDLTKAMEDVQHNALQSAEG